MLKGYGKLLLLHVEFTVLYVHVLYVSHPLALEGSSTYAKELVQRFFRKYTNIDPDRVDAHARKFLRLAADSRIEIAFVGKPRNYQAPSYRIYKYDTSESLTVVFEVEVRIIRRYINPGYDYAEIEIEGTDFLSTYCAGLPEELDSRRRIIIQE
jgi:hypothetical protein